VVEELVLNRELLELQILVVVVAVEQEILILLAEQAVQVSS
jgi:hypothetical protein